MKARPAKAERRCECGAVLPTRRGGSGRQRVRCDDCKRTTRDTKQMTETYAYVAAALQAKRRQGTGGHG